MWRTGLGDAQGGDVDELLEAELAAALDADAGLLDAAEGGAGAAAGVGVDAANAGLDARGELGTLLQVVRPDLDISPRHCYLRANHKPELLKPASKHGEQ